ncbi:MAG TPA: hypothetical protein VFG25_04580 [Nitrosopumilaceae archaeon]|nr:hypothetical protein [Nitrosopumilaceae archaeon]
MNSIDKKIVIIGIVAGIVGLAVMIGFIGQGNVRHVAIFWQEKVEQTVVFEDINGTVQLRGIVGISGEPNPTLISRTGFAYLLTVVNDGEKNHRLYIDGLNVQTDLLDPGERETLTIYPTEEGVYNYYDKRERLKLLGQLKIVSVVPSDEFQGPLKDLI